MSDAESPPESPTAAADDQRIENGDHSDADNDKDSDILSEIDADQFEDYDPATANIEDRPVNIDEDVARTLKASKRRRAEGDGPKKKEGKREKKRNRDDDVTSEGGERARKARRSDGQPRAEKASPVPERLEDLTPEERRRRALERALDAAAKGPVKRRKRRDEMVRTRCMDFGIAFLTLA
jgi:transcription factor SPN1